jgi:hypothetical protein
MSSGGYHAGATAVLSIADTETNLENSEPPDDWVKMAQAMHRLTEAAAWDQARKCVWYDKQGPDKDVRRRASQ